ncbi:hypothetical protein ACHAW6_001769 [Cyclotella cf. meneghiniana]
MVFTTMIDIEGHLFTDQTGRFPISSNCSNNYIVIFYVVDPNYIKSYPIKSRHRLKAYKETLKDVEKFIVENNSKFQYTPPNIDCTNTAECTIQTWKNHFVSIRAGTPCTYHLSNWSKDLEQTDITLNVLCPCTTNPLLSVYEALEGMFSFNRTPMTPIGTKIMIHIKPAGHQT